VRYQIPADPEAELAVVGCAIDSPHGADLAHQRLQAGHFHDPALADLFAAAPTLPTTAPDGELTTDVRIAASAATTRIHPDHIRRIVAGRPVMWDTGGVYARRVLDAHQRRQGIADLEQAILDLAAGTAA
jgi:replicative DNA helicase